MPCDNTAGFFNGWFFDEGSLLSFLGDLICKPIIRPKKVVFMHIWSECSTITLWILSFRIRVFFCMRFLEKIQNVFLLAPMHGCKVFYSTGYREFNVIRLRRCISNGSFHRLILKTFEPTILPFTKEAGSLEPRTKGPGYFLQHGDSCRFESSVVNDAF